MDPDYVVKAAQIAYLLEVSSYPKPGNIHRFHDFEDMSYEDFLISSVVVGDTIRKAAIKGKDLSDNNDFYSIGLGELILEAVTETSKWVNTNTNLGILMLTLPIVIAAPIQDNFHDIRMNITKIMANTTPNDAVNLYKAMIISNPGGMGEEEELDVFNKNSQKQIINDQINIYDILKMSSDKDLISRELTTSMPIIFELGFPTFKKFYKNNSYNLATLETFLTILSKFPDTLISRKYGFDKASEISNEAKKILNNGGALTNKGFNDLKKFDKKLYDHKINPGTTADLTAASILVSILSEYNKY